MCKKPWFIVFKDECTTWSRFVLRELYEGPISNLLLSILHLLRSLSRNQQRIREDISPSFPTIPLRGIITLSFGTKVSTFRHKDTNTPRGLTLFYTVVIPGVISDVSKPTRFLKSPKELTRRSFTYEFTFWLPFQNERLYFDEWSRLIKCHSVSISPYVYRLSIPRELDQRMIYNPSCISFFVVREQPWLKSYRFLLFFIRWNDRNCQM